MEIFSDFKIKIIHAQKRGWYYKLYSLDGHTLLDTGDEFYESEGIARLAAIGHIHLMEVNKSESERS